MMLNEAETKLLLASNLIPSKIIDAKIVHTERYTLSVVQYQPTDRPIEDRYSVHEDEEKKRLILGVYDGNSSCQMFWLAELKVV